MNWEVWKLPLWSLDVTPKYVCRLLHRLHAAAAAGMCWVMGTWIFCAGVATFCGSRSSNTAISWSTPKTPSPPRRCAQKHPQLLPAEPEDPLPKDRSTDVWHSLAKRIYCFFPSLGLLHKGASPPFCNLGRQIPQKFHHV